jgi:hypothetical protein
MKDWIEAMLMMRPLLVRKAEKGVRHVEHAIEVHRHDLLPILDHGVGIASERVAPVDAGIVDQDRGLTEAACDSGGDDAAGVAVADVEREGMRLAAGFGNVRRGFGSPVAIDVEHGDRRALAGKAARDGAADPGGGAGYGRDVILQKSGHSVSSPCHLKRTKHSSSTRADEGMLRGNPSREYPARSARRPNHVN